MKKYIIIILMIVSAISLNAEYSWELDKKFNIFKFDYFAEDSSGNLYLATENNLLFTSWNDGKSWHPMELSLYKTVNSISCSQDNVLYFTRKDSIFYSTDYGFTLEEFNFNNPFVRDSFYLWFSIFNKNDTIIIFEYAKAKFSDYHSKHLFYSVDKGDTWLENLFFRNGNDSLDKDKCYIDKQGRIFITTQFSIYYMASVKSDLKKTEGALPSNYLYSKFFEDDSNNLYFLTGYELYILNNKTDVWELVASTSSIWWDMYYYNGRIFYIDRIDHKIMVSDDKLKTSKLLRKIEWGPDLWPHFFVTKKGTLLHSSKDGFWRGIDLAAVNESYISNDVMISPNPATNYIEISVPEDVNQRFKSLVQEVRIYNVFGQEINLTPALSILGEGENNPLYPPFLRGNLKIDVSGLSSGVYFVRVGGRVGKLLKM